MTTLRAQVALLNVNGLPADSATNTWHFTSNAVDRLVDAAQIVSDLDAFYGSIGGVLSEACSGDANIRIYDLADGTPRVPILEDEFAFTPGTGQGLPAEVAVVLSFHGATFSGSPPARRRGRLYIGPIDAGMLSTGDGNVFVSSTAAGDIRSAAQALLGDADPEGASWAVFSPTTAGPEPWSAGELLAATFEVVAGHVDNAFDTMRSRGVASTSRVFFPI